MYYLRFSKQILKLLAAIMVASILSGFSSISVAQNIPYDLTNKGPTLESPIKVHLIYWFPPGVIADYRYSDGVGDFQTVIDLFFGDEFQNPDFPGINGSAWLNIATQYPGICGSTRCVLQNAIGSVKLADSFIDTRAYPHAGTQLDPLQDQDVRDEINRVITERKWTIDANNAVFVITGIFQSTLFSVEECYEGSCTFAKGDQPFCGYHDNYSREDNKVHYAYLHSARFSTLDCTKRITQPLGSRLLSSDQSEVAGLV
jgi:hypothetical protein